MRGMDSVAVMPMPPGLIHNLDGPGGDNNVVYDIVASGDLPIIDISRSVRTVLFPESFVKRFDRIVTKSRALLFVTGSIAMVIAAVIPFVNIRLGRWLAVLLFFIGLPTPIVQAMYMRYEILLLLVRTYDVWFFSITLFVSMVLFTICLGDVRGLLSFGLWFSLQTTILVDAAPAVRESIWLTFLGLLFSLLIMAAIEFDAYNGLRDFDIFVVNGYVVSAKTVVLNGWSTCLLVLVRNIYRRRAAVRDHGKRNSTVVQCLSYRCRVRLRAREKRRRSANSLTSLTSVSSTGSSHMTRPTTSYFQNAKMVQMRCMRVKFKISPRNLVAKFAIRLLDCSDTDQSVVVFRRLLILLMQAGVVLTMLSFIPGVPASCHYGSLGTTALFCTVSLGMLHRQLLKYVVFSFDFAFLSFQLTTIHLALCDLYTWDSRAFPIASVWLWYHWVLTFDCIPPVIKAKVRFRYRYVVLIAVQFVVAHVFLLYQLVAFDRHTFRDRAIMDIRLRSLRVEPDVHDVLLVVSYCLATPATPIIIQGTVTYLNNRRKIKLQEAEYLATRTKSAMVQMKRALSRRLSHFAIPVVQAAASVPTKVHPIPSSSVAPAPAARNARFINAVGHVYDASRVISTLQQQNRTKSERKRSVVESGPMLFQVVNNPQRKSAVESDGSIMKITALDISTRSVQTDTLNRPVSEAAGSEKPSDDEQDRSPGFII